MNIISERPRSLENLVTVAGWFGLIMLLIAATLFLADAILFPDSVMSSRLIAAGWFLGGAVLGLTVWLAAKVAVLVRRRSR